MEKANALVIGASGGIGSQLVSDLAADSRFEAIHGVTRRRVQEPIDDVIYHQVDSQDESQIAQCCQTLGKQGRFSLVVCCIGALHGEQNGVTLQPEKQLQDISSKQLLSYFQTNSVTPMLWLKHLLPLVKSQQPSYVVMLSARVGSITDNHLGGWYGYRASKAALNMLIKTSQVEYTRRAKNVQLVSYHPGTVDSALSKPFQGNVAKDKLFTPAFTSTQLLSHLPQLNPADAPHFIDWDNKVIAW